MKIGDPVRVQTTSGKIYNPTWDTGRIVRLVGEFFEVELPSGERRLFAEEGMERI